MTLTTIVRQAPPESMGFSNQENWSWLPVPSPGESYQPNRNPNPFLVRVGDKKIMIQNPWDVAKLTPRGKFIAM